MKNTSKEILSKQSSPERESVSSIVAEMSEVQAEAALLHRQRMLPLLFVSTLLTCSVVFSHVLLFLAMPAAAERCRGPTPLKFVSFAHRLTRLRSRAFSKKAFLCAFYCPTEINVFNLIGYTT